MLIRRKFFIRVYEDDDADKNYIDICGDFVRILHGESAHRYLGRQLSASSKRFDIEFINRNQSKGKSKQI